MDEDFAARTLKIVHMASEEMRATRRPCVLERADHHNGQTATLMLVRATARLAMGDEVCKSPGSLGSAAVSH